MERGPLWEHQVFCAVAERQSFVLAARALGASPSAVTRAVQALERQLGAQLLTRSKTSVTLTPQGERYVESARDMLRLKKARAKRCARRSAAPRAGCAFPRPTCWAWRCCRPCCGAMPRTTPTCASTSAIPTNGWIRSPKDWTSPFAAAFPPPASCWARACGPMSDCYAPARTTWRAWDCRANRKTWCATASSCTPARACSRTGTCAARAASSACARSRPSASALAAA